MAHDRTERRRPDRRTFRPTLEGDRLETRVLMASLSQITAHTAYGGQATVVTDPTGQRFYLSVVNGGTIRAFPAPGGRVSIIVDGSNPQSMLEINKIQPAHRTAKGAHTFRTQLESQTGVLNIASIVVTSGSIFAIEGYHSANLYGSLVVGGPTRVDRIALNSVMPGASIGVGGDLNTLDIASDATFTGSTGLFVGRDLNWAQINGNLSFANGANLNIVRDLGAVFQPPKGTGNAGQGLNVRGNLVIGPDAVASIGRSVPLFSGVLINGNLAGGSKIFIAGTPLSSLPFNFAVDGHASA